MLLLLYLDIFAALKALASSYEMALVARANRLLYNHDAPTLAR